MSGQASSSGRLLVVYTAAGVRGCGPSKVAKLARLSRAPAASRVAAPRYRPFFRQHVAFDPTLARTTGQLPRIYPGPGRRTMAIALTNAGSRSPFGVLAVDSIPSVHLIGSDITAVLPRTVGSTHQSNESPTLFGSHTNVSNINSAALRAMQERYGADVDEDAVFAYVYGILHSPDFRSTFAVNLRKEAPRIPLVDSRTEFDAFASAGKEVFDLHIGYESVDPYPLREEWADGADPDADPSLLLVGTRKMFYPKVADREDGPEGSRPNPTRPQPTPHFVADPSAGARVCERNPLTS